jgi:hypothetical protein
VVVFVALCALVGVAAISAATVVLRRRSLKSEPSAFKAQIRVTEGAVVGVSRKWRGGYGRWVRDVLVWNKAPLLLQTRLIPVEGVDTSGIHGAAGVQAKRLGKDPLVLPFVTEDHGHVEMVVSSSNREHALGPFAHAAAVGSLVQARHPSPRSGQPMTDDTEGS